MPFHLTTTHRQAHKMCAQPHKTGRQGSIIHWQMNITDFQMNIRHRQLRN
jgi:hypothetical protein